MHFLKCSFEKVTYGISCYSSDHEKDNRDNSSICFVGKNLSFVGMAKLWSIVEKIYNQRYIKVKDSVRKVHYISKTGQTCRNGRQGITTRQVFQHTPISTYGTNKYTNK
jgi:hypothetical protein